MTRPLGQAGQVLPLVALLLTALLGFSGLAVDVGFWEYQQHQQQNATDAAALGGAEKLAYTACPDSSAATTAADNDSAGNGFVNGGNVTVTVQNPPSSGPYAGNSCAVYVQITAVKVPSFFTRLLGHATGISETTQAVAQILANGNGCIYLLSPTAASTFNGDTVDSPSCGVYINDTATFNGDPTFAAPYIGYAGSAPVENGSDFTLATPAPMVAVANPCPTITGCNYLANNPPAAGTGCISQTYTGEATATVAPGCYSSLTVVGGTNLVFSGGTYVFNSIDIDGTTNVSFGSGLYVFNGSTTFNGESSVSGSGVTLYVTADGTPPVFNGISSLTLSPPTSGNYDGVLYYQVPSNTQSPTFNGVSMTISGLIYAPGATDAVFNGTSGHYLVIVVGAATFNGSAAYDIASPPPNGSLTHTAVLGQ
jgi:Putative Flp pilus-assembly TadE/G-like